MSERVEREFEQWKNQYDITLDQEFQVKTLLKLQEEYDSITPGEHNTKTRQTLLDMINRVWCSLRLQPKDKKYFEIKSKIDGIWFKVNENDKDRLKVEFDDMINKIIHKELKQYI